MAVSFTDEQLSAIYARDKTLLVSAGAGAGKTATLTERIIRQLLDENSPMDISRMLIVTFTKAAAAELRERIGKAIRNAVLQNPKNRHLESQLHLLPSAKISTIDSFCNDIFKNNAERFGISPKYRILDPAEGEILSRNILSALIGAIYDGEATEIASPTEFSLLSDSLAGVKTELNVEDVFMKLYRDSQSLSDGVEIFARHRDMMAKNSHAPLDSPHVGVAIDKARSLASLYLDVYEATYPELIREIDTVSAPCEDEESSEKKSKKKKSSIPTQIKYLEVMKTDESRFKKIIAVRDYTEIRAILSEGMESSPSISASVETPLLLRLKEMRKEMCGSFTSLFNDLFKWEKVGWADAFERLAKFTDILYRVLKKFDKMYTAEKKRRAALEYSDIERLAYMSLYNEEGGLTDFAYAQREQYDAVYIDEYQDVNELQNNIFEAVSKNNNRFMVGDIKQSIYGFRGASPEIFRALKTSFPPINNSEGKSAATVFMSKNFRCDRGIIDFVNTAFDRLFAITSESIGYVKEDRLEFSKYKKEDEPPYRKPVLKVFSTEDIPDGGELERSEISAIYVAKKIKELLETGRLNDGRAITPSDIAILLRKDSGKAEIYKRVLEREGIPTSSSNDKTFFENADVQLTLCLLNAIDNPTRDIYLAGLMLSPLYSFTADELVIIKNTTREASLWQSLNTYTDNNEAFVKGRSFIDSLNKYRALSEGMSTDALIMRLYSETGLLALAMRTGGRENLMRLYNYARSFEGTSYKGLHNFISYVNTAIERGASFSEKNGESEVCAVSIISMHSSKGLEYPVVFIGEAGGNLVSTREKSEPYRIHPELGFAVNPKSEKINALIESPVFNAIGVAMGIRSIYEELRIIYVAFTRAREYLYIVGKTRKSSFEELKASLGARANSNSIQSLLSVSSLLELVILSAEGAYDLDTESLIPEAPETDSATEHSESVAPTPVPISKADSVLSSLITERLTYEYPRAHLTTLPEKMSISRLHPRVLDGVDKEEFDLITVENEPDPTKKKSPLLPEFIETNKEEESKRRGIATHTFMQFCDIEALKDKGAEAELERLVQRGFLTKEDAARVRLPEIEKFKSSDLLCMMLEAKSIYREFRFNVNLPASLFTDDAEKKKLYEGSNVLLQGVIDCIFEDAEGNLHLVDYKTDRLSREELSDVTLAEKKLRDKHSPQLSYYALAVGKIFGKAPKTISVYSLHLGASVYTENILE